MSLLLQVSILVISSFLLLTVASRVGFAQPLKPVAFSHVLEKRLSSEISGGEWNFENFCQVSSDVVSRRVLESYGSMFVANESVKLPPTCVHKGEGDVLRYQRKLGRKSLVIDGVQIDLQAAATDALAASIAEAAAMGLRITPLDGAIAGGRSYGDTLMLWNSRFFPAMEFWIRKGRLSPADRDLLARLDISGKVAKVLEWESQGIFFSTDRTRSILTSTAPPGTSQHLALLAFDVTEFWNPNVRSLLNRNGWFQTVVDDPAHFTFLGFTESELPARGLIAVSKGGRQYWVPNLPATPWPSNLTN
ncbi:MAG: hypothetical protein ABI857_11075 [Acidobacteriota bacterium]